MIKNIQNINLALALILICILNISPSFANVQNMLGKLNNPYASEVNTLAEGLDNTIFAGTWGDGVYKSTDLGVSFTKTSTGLDSYNSKYINDISFNLNTIFIATNGDGVYKSVDNGNTWTKSSTGLRNLRVISVLASGTTIYASTKGDGVFRSLDNGDTWQDFSEGLFFQDMGELYETPLGSILVSTWGVGVFRLPKDSMDVGNFMWERASSGIYRLEDFSIYATSFNVDRNGMVYVGTLGKGVFSSEDDGYSWIGERVDELLDHNITAFSFTEDDQKDNLIAGTRNWGCWYWVDNGPEQEWEPGINTSYYGINDLIRISDGNYLSASTAYGIMKTTNNGILWESQQFGNTAYKQSVEFKNNMIFASGDFDGLQRSTDFGLTWATSLNLTDIDMVTKNANMFAAISKTELAISEDDGDTWTNPVVPEFHFDVGDWSLAGREFTDVEITANNTIYISYEVIYITEADPPDPIDPPDVTYGIFVSTDKGLTWVNNESPNSLNKNFVGISSPASNQLYAINKFDSLYVSTDAGTTWVQRVVDNSKTNLRLSKVDSYGNRVLVGTWDGVYLSTDNGLTYSEVDIDYIDTKTFGAVSKRVESLNMDDNSNYQVGFGQHSGLFKTENGGTDWDSLNPAYSMSKIKSIGSNSDGDKMFGGIGIYNYVNPENFDPPALISPANGTFDIAVNYPNNKGQEKPILSWEKANKADMYEMQISANDLFSQVEAKYTFASRTWTTNFDFEYNHTYYWKVRSKTNDSYSRWSEVFTFTTELEPPVLAYPSIDDICVLSSDTFTWNSVDGAETYDIEISADVNFTEPVINSITDISNTFTISQNLNNSSTYWWRAMAKNANSTSSWSEASYFVTALAPPALTFPADSATEVDPDLDFLFNPPVGTNSVFIEIYRDSEMTDPVIKSTTTDLNTHYTDVLEFNVCYWWRLSSTDDNCNSEWSDLSYFCTGIAPPSLFLPENGAYAQELDLKIRWDNFQNADAYMFEVATDQNFTETINSGTTTELNEQIDDLDNFTTYFWRVKVIMSGQEGAWSEIWSFRTKMSIIEQISPICAETDISTLATFMWNELTGAETYNFQISNNFAFNSPIIDTNVAENQYKVNNEDGLEADEDYFWRVQGVNSDSTSEWTEPCSFTTKPNSVEEAIINNIETSVFPNPFNKSTTIKYTLIKNAEIKISVYNMTGMKIVDLLDSYKVAGEYTIEWTPNNLSNGAYYYQIKIGSALITKELMITN